MESKELKFEWLMPSRAAMEANPKTWGCGDGRAAGAQRWGGLMVGKGCGGVSQPGALGAARALWAMPWCRCLWGAQERPRCVYLPMVLVLPVHAVAGAATGQTTRVGNGSGSTGLSSGRMERP